MGIVERKERERQEMRELIQKAALMLFIEKGFDNVSIRNIADRIEYSPTTIYLYFKDKNELLHEIHTQGFTQLAEGFIHVFNEPDSFERFRLIGLAYIKFALENAELYDLMFVQQHADEYLKQHDESWDEGQSAFGILKNIVEDCMKAGYMPMNNIEMFSFYVWGSLHGMIMLQSKERCLSVISDESKGSILHNSFELFINNLRALKKN
jgi:AcrR family transcriptional regulator